ncbi:hypothetical protein E5Q_01345 [Mixia osmundae IAM 14324]|uniref:alpha-1,6-mannosyl-glycoprotein 6-beta-N-acetylglucosaminyltransferase n=1 Tax=Mixia osmundae (strain CBS 9802 / IAM 14324 / JCM 22182 / KY 12970) TaxID=764103 RepID=G7DVT2_MIXOS|nr:hypothetical protein E5Q_01345 [Mixia osmundae IAM 14324]
MHRSSTAGNWVDLVASRVRKRLIPFVLLAALLLLVLWSYSDTRVQLAAQAQKQRFLGSLGHHPSDKKFGEQQDDLGSDELLSDQSDAEPALHRQLNDELLNEAQAKRPISPAKPPVAPAIDESKHTEPESTSKSLDDIKPDDEAREFASHFFPPPPLSAGRESEWKEKRRRDLAIAYHCVINADQCPAHAKKVVLCGAGRFRWALDGTFERPSAFANGEAILAKSFMYAMDQGGYPFIYLDEGEMGKIDEIVQKISTLYKILGEHVRAVIFDYTGERECMLKNARCLLSDTNEDGIPKWKMFAWDAMGSILPDYETVSRWKWHLTGIPVAEATWLGITLSKDCSMFPYVPFADRSHKAYVLGKERRYFLESKCSWQPEDFKTVVDATGLKLVAGVKEAKEGEEPLPDSIENLGPATRAGFIEALGTAKVVIGVGGPTESPSPLEAICMGTPFINPGLPVNGGHGTEWDGDFVHWKAQHKFLLHYGPPYVYNVLAKKGTALLEAVQSALANPMTEPYLPPELSDEQYLGRVDALLNDDWQALYESKIAGGEFFEP